jgi:N-methylhydantoinase A/oxoprolinase/acetone carboxylase beta subunit
MRVGVDSGGTFTDFIAWDGTRLRSFKLRSTPDNPARAILDGLSRVVAMEVVHGSTVATNALLQRNGARTAFVATGGFEDLLELARQRREELYNWSPLPRRRLVQEDRKFGLSERMLHDGTVLEPLSAEETARLASRIGDVDSVAVCLLHSYANPAHEKQVGHALRGAGYAVSLSSEILPEYREYERAATTVVNAYVSPLVQRYIRSLEACLPRARLRVFQSNGGSISATEASEQAVRTVLSGPAGGLVGAAAVARLLGIDRFVSFDMGGTSTDVSLYDGAPRYTTEGGAAGLPIRVPMLDIESIGAGGGSVAYFDEGRALRVGPRSAGASPGPVCYGSGEELTVTDANLLLGRIETGSFLEGTIRLDADRAREFAARAASRAGIGIEQLARAIVRAANAKMERAIRSVSVERGHNPRDYAMICFGGAGALHACELAEILEIPRVIVPAHAGVLSALGMLVADCVRDYSASVLNADRHAAFARLERAARRDMRQQGFDEVALVRTIDMRYEGQSYEINVPRDRTGAFDEAHERRYGYRHAGRATQAVTARVQAIGRTKEADRPDLAAASHQPRFASIHVPNGWRRREEVGSNTILERAG